MPRFDEIELEPVPELAPIETPVAPAETARSTEAGVDRAPLFRRLLALLTDLSLFVALTLALSPLLPMTRTTASIVALAGFVLMTSYYYFAGTWLLWGKTIGGAIFDVRVVAETQTAMSVRSATFRWIGLIASLLTAGIGFAIAVFPGRRSLADRLSHTHCVAAL